MINNRKCANCGKPILGCNCKESWKNLACSIKCFQEFMSKQEGEESMAVLLRIENKKFQTDDIVEYDLSKMEFKSTIKTYKIEDINAFIVPAKEMMKLLKNELPIPKLDVGSDSKEVEDEELTNPRNRKISKARMSY